MSTLRVGDPMDKNTDVGAINSKAQLATIEKYPARSGRPRAASGTTSGTGALPAKGFFCRPCFFTGVQPSAHDRARGDLRPGAGGDDLPHARGGHQRRTTRPTASAAGVWTDKGSKIFDVARKLKAGVVWLNTYNKFDPTSPLRRVQGVGFGREGGVHTIRSARLVAPPLAVGAISAPWVEAWVVS
jgi:aldehyde dehydrogenase (NAD+)